MRFEQSESRPRVCGALFTVDGGKCVDVERVNVE
jgi:hypothetical protein